MNEQGFATSTLINRNIGLLGEKWFFFAKNVTIPVGQLHDILKTSSKVVLMLLRDLEMHNYTVLTGDIQCPTLKIIELAE